MHLKSHIGSAKVWVGKAIDDCRMNIDANEIGEPDDNVAALRHYVALAQMRAWLIVQRDLKNLERSIENAEKLDGVS